MFFVIRFDLLNLLLFNGGYRKKAFCSISNGLLEYVFFFWNLILVGSVREVRAGAIFEGTSWCFMAGMESSDIFPVLL